MASECYELSKDELRQLQFVMLDMLVEFDRICRLHNLKYIIDGGTLLGAVRHKGFIPWDDDVDVAMLRSDYEKFCRVVGFELDSDKYFFQNHRTDDNYRFGYAKIRLNNSEYIKAGQEHIRAKSGIFIDIFPIDGLPENCFMRRLVNFKCFFLRKCSYAEIGAVVEKNTIKRFLYKAANAIPINCIFRSIERFVLKSYNATSKYVRILTLPLQRSGQTGYKRVWFEDISEVYEFEGHVYPGPTDVDGYLRSQYGNYMELPPESERKAHSVVRIRFY